MHDVTVIDDPAAAEASLDPIRARLLAELAEPGSASTLATRVGLTRQKANYHLRALERHGLVELVEEHSQPRLAPVPGVHHLAFMVDDLRAGIEWCVAQGWHEVLFARTTGGQEFAFCDARADLGHFVEMYEPSDRLLGFYAKVAAAAADWMGEEPVRVI